MIKINFPHLTTFSWLYPLKSHKWYYLHHSLLYLWKWKPSRIYFSSPFLTIYFLFIFSSLASRLSSSCSCSMSFPKRMYMPNIFKSWVSLMIVTFCCHSLHIELRISLTHTWLGTILLIFSNLLIIWENLICVEAKSYPDSTRKSSNSYIKLLI